MSELRHSIADPVELITDPDEKARREAENGVRQFKAAMEAVKTHILRPENPFRLTQALILDLNQKALEGIHPLAGTYRNSPVTIGQSNHTPPRHVEVADHVAEMCGHVNDNWNEQSAIQLASYVLWKLNWIHPFADGNGRTSRAVSYVVLNVKLNSILPGAPTIPDQIAANKSRYYEALEYADGLWKRERIISLAHMEHMLEGMLAQQLLNATKEAGA
jgi:Fic family protein